MFSIGSLYIIKTWDRDGAFRDQPRGRDAAAITASAPADGVRTVRTGADRPPR